jgi:hypothetical protein
MAVSPLRENLAFRRKFRATLAILKNGHILK